MQAVEDIMRAIIEMDYRVGQRLTIDDEINGVPVSYATLNHIGKIHPIYRIENDSYVFKGNRVVLNEKARILPKEIIEAVVEHEKLHADNLEPNCVYFKDYLFVDGSDSENGFEPSINRIFIDTLAFMKTRNEWSTLLPFIRKEIYEFLEIV